MYSLLIPLSSTTPKKDTVNLKLDETEILFVLSTLINVKKDKRKLLIQELAKLGVLI